MTLKGTTKEFPLEVILGLLKDSKKTGELAMRGPKGEGALGFAEGRVVTAVYGSEKPIPALGAVFDLGEVDFEFVPWTEAPAANLEGELDENLKRADEYAKWLADVREVIPHDGIRFRLSERAADQGAVTFTADRWRVVMAVNTRPSVTELATNLHIDRDDALTTLAGLVRDGVIETIDEPAPAAGPAPAPGPPPEAEMSAPPTFVPSEPAMPEPAPAEPAPPAAQVPAEDWTAALVRKAEAQSAPEPEPEPSPLPPPAAAESAPTPPPAPTQSTTAPADAWSAIPAQLAPAQDTAEAPPVPDWTSSPSTDVPVWSPAPSAPPATNWSAVPTTPLPEDAAPPPPPPDWTSGATGSSTEWTAPPQEWSPAQTPPPPDWTSAPAPTEPPPFIQESVPSAPASFGAPEPAAAEPAAAEPEPAAPPVNEWATAPAEPAPMDDRLAALQGMFDKPAPAQPQAWTPANDTWVTPGKPAPAAEDPRLAAMSAPAPAPAAPPTQASSTPNEWGTPPPGFGAPAPAQPKKSGGLFGGLFGGKKAAQTSPAASATNGGAASRAGKLAAFSNALLTEYTSGTYGKGKVDDRMPSLLMRVDEQADPIDRPLPIVDDRLDVQALERVNIAEQQAVPYLATLVATIFGDAEKAFGKDKAKRGYKAAQQQIFGGDTSALSGPDLAGKLPKV